MQKKTALIVWIMVLVLSVRAASAFAQEAADDGVIILSYGRIDDEHSENSISSNILKEHFKVISEKFIPVLPLPRVLDAVNLGFKGRGVAITLTGGFRSTLTEAIPLLRAQNIPYTVVYAADRADFPGATYLSWADLRRIQEDPLATLAVMPASGETLIGLAEVEILRALTRAKTRHREELKTEPKIFAYPNGEYTPALKAIIEDQGYDGALALSSGPVWAGSDPFALPRFAITEDTARLEHFRWILAARPLPVSDFEPSSPIVTTARPNLGFTLPEALAAQAQNLRCYVSGQAPAMIERLGSGRIELRLSAPLSAYRTRLNCILPYQTGADADPQDGVWRWFGLLLLRPGLQED